ncbi:MAG: prolyl oligopeptidase family serine peptidase [Puia sp.]|nr:prolyl oligopeptidase family serine peptidase [Puia sp.]
MHKKISMSRSTDVVRPRFLFVFLIAFVLFFRAAAQQTHEEVVRPVDYLLALPDGYKDDTVKKWPLILFLHGSGESGADLEKVKVHGPPKLIEQGKKLPFIVVSPQAPEARLGWQTEDLYFLLQECKRRYRVDADRIYLTGLSMGGFGAWALAIKHPEEFAAVVPICGGGDTADIWKLRNMPVWCFHGGKDSTVPIARDREMVEALRRYNPSVRFTVYPELGHNSWTVTYENDSLYQWMLTKTKFSYPESPVDAGVLKQYTGTYTAHESGQLDTVVISVDDGKLRATVRSKEAFELKHASDNIFFIQGNLPVDIRFSRNAAGKVTGFVVYENERIRFEKLLPGKK